MRDFSDEARETLECCKQISEDQHVHWNAKLQSLCPEASNRNGDCVGDWTRGHSYSLWYGTCLCFACVLRLRLR